MTKIKICGLKQECDATYLNKVLPDYAGFVFVKGRRRYIEPGKAAVLRCMLDKRIRTVGVFIDEKPETIKSLVDCDIIDAVQLHGNETAQYIMKIKALTGKTVIKVFKAPQTQETELSAWYESVENSPADLVLIDTGAGTGRAFDWNIAKEIKRPYILAGGLSPENVSEAIKLLHPFGVDVSSGVETDGAKDEHKIERFIEAVKKENQDE